MPSDDRTFPRCSFYRFTLRYTGPDIDVSETGFRDASARSSILDMKDAREDEQRESRVLTNVRHFLKNEERALEKGLR